MREQHIIRDSNFEMLRILCMFGIVTMHTFGIIYNSATGFNLVCGVFINSIFNCGVTIFMLISGYYGIHFKIKKVIKLEIMIISYSVLGYIASYLITNEFNAKQMIKAMLPVTSGKYWYMTSYMIILIFSTFINQISNEIDKKRFRVLIFMLVVIYSIIPSIVQIHIMNDGGKGIINMLLIYLIGRYIRIYCHRTYNFRKIIIGTFISIIITFGLNIVITFAKGGKGIVAPFARDCSITIIISSITIFMLFRQIRLESKTINYIAKNVIGIYLFEEVVRLVINTFFDLRRYEKSYYLCLILLIYVIIVMAISILVNIFMNYISNRILNLVFYYVEKRKEVIYRYFEKVVYYLKMTNRAILK